MKEEKERIREIVDDPENKQIVALVKNGLPYDEVRHWQKERRAAFLIICGEAEGHKWDWGRMQWTAGVGLYGSA